MASTYLSRTQSSPNSQIFTISMWLKKCGTNSAFPMNMGSNDDNRIGILFNGNELELYGKVSASSVLDVRTNALYRDVNSWYHIVAKVDTTQATASDRAKIYVNGEEITSLKTSIYPSQNTNFSLTNHYIGNLDNAQSYYFDGYITHYHYTDGTAYDASTFGETDATTGIWKPKTAP